MEIHLKNIFTHNKIFLKKFQKLIFYGCKQKNNNKLFILLNFINNSEQIKNAIFQD